MSVIFRRFERRQRPPIGWCVNNYNVREGEFIRGSGTEVPQLGPEVIRGDAIPQWGSRSRPVRILGTKFAEAGGYLQVVKE